MDAEIKTYAIDRKAWIIVPSIVVSNFYILVVLGMGSILVII